MKYLKKLCKFLNDHSELSIISGLALIAISTVISIDKSVEIMQLKSNMGELQQKLNSSYRDLADQKMVNDLLHSQYQATQDRWIEDKNRYLKRQSDEQLRKSKESKGVKK